MELMGLGGGSDSSSAVVLLPNAEEVEEEADEEPEELQGVVLYDDAGTLPSHAPLTTGPRTARLDALRSPGTMMQASEPTTPRVCCCVLLSSFLFSRRGRRRRRTDPRSRGFLLPAGGVVRHCYCCVPPLRIRPPPEARR